ncbi:MAG: DUF2007 domain-containing protein [Longimicrobiales bacterium]
MMETTACSRCGQQFDATENGCPVCGQLQQPAACQFHPERSAEMQCVLCGSALCDDCNHGSSHGACELHADIPVIDGWAQVYTTSDEVDAQLIRENFLAEGIDAEVLSQRDQTFRLEVGDLSAVRVLVPAFDYLVAREVMAGHMDGQGEVAFACETCGEAYDAGQEICASCQAPLPTASA